MSGRKDLNKAQPITVGRAPVTSDTMLAAEMADAYKELAEALLHRDKVRDGAKANMNYSASPFMFEMSMGNQAEYPFTRAMVNAAHDLWLNIIERALHEEDARVQRAQTAVAKILARVLPNES